MQGTPTTTQEFWDWLRYFSQAGLFTLTDWLGGMAGLVISVFALINAKRAREAANEARNAVYQKSAIEELDGACKLTEQLHDFVNQDRHPEGELRATEIMKGLSEFAERRKGHLSSTDRDTVLMVRTQIQIVRQRLTEAERAPLPVRTKNATLKILETQGIMVLGSLLGRMKDTLDREDRNAK
jgi:hypothetical protein